MIIIETSPTSECKTSFDFFRFWIGCQSNQKLSYQPTLKAFKIQIMKQNLIWYFDFMHQVVLINHKMFKEILFQSVNQQAWNKYNLQVWERVAGISRHLN